MWPTPISLNPLCHARRLLFHVPYHNRHLPATCRRPDRLSTRLLTALLGPDLGLTDQPSPGLSINLSSNNPFRNRAGSPLPKSPASPFDDPSPQSSRPVSNNPFLDPSQKPASPSTATAANSAPLITMADEKDTKPSAELEKMFVRTCDCYQYLADGLRSRSSPEACASSPTLASLTLITI